MNITDLDDKIFKRAQEKGKDFSSFAQEWEAEFFEDMKALDVQLPTVITRASEFIPEMIKFIDGVIDRGFAYVSNGSVYFDIQAYRESGRHIYGKLWPTQFDNDVFCFNSIWYKILVGDG